MRPVFIKAKNNTVVNATNALSFSIDDIERYNSSGSITHTFKIYANGSGISEELVEVGSRELAESILKDVLTTISNPSPSKPLNVLNLQKYDISILASKGSTAENGSK